MNPPERPRMAVRAYRKLLSSCVGVTEEDRSQLPQYEDVFVVLERPLLEFSKYDLHFLKERGIDPFLL
jgi:hypothetical protein